MSLELCVLSTSLQGHHKAQPNLQYHTICCVQPVPAVAGVQLAPVPSTSSNCYPSQAVELPVQEYLCPVRGSVGVKERGSRRKGSNSHLRHNPGV